MLVKRQFRYVAIACVLLLAAMLPLIAAEYRGQVKFNSLPLPGAQVTATQGDKKMNAVSDEQGNFMFPDLPDGTWQLQVEMMGFAPAKQEITQGTGLPGPSFDLKMLPIDEIKAVAAPAAPAATPGATTGAAPTQTTSAAPAGAGEATPSLNASIAAANAAAAASAKPAAKGKGKNAVPATASTAFQRTDLNSSTGAPPPATGAAAPEVTNELRSQAADANLINGSAQNGASSPFAQNPAFGNNRKGGPRLYTYSLLLNESNSALNAAPFSTIGQSEKQPYNQLTGGFQFGGPMRIPHLVQTRNNVQFQIGYQRVENRTSSVSPVLMPTAAEREGDFSNVIAGGQPVQIFNPSTNQPFANNMIPASLISRQAQSLLQYYPLPNFTGSTAYNYQIPTIGNTHTDNLRTSASKSFKRRNFLSGQFAMQDTRGDQDSTFNFLDLRRSFGMQATASYRRTYTPRFYGTFTYQFSRQSTRTLPYFSNLTNVSGNAGITGNDQVPLEWGPPQLSFQQSQITGLSDQTASVLKNQTSAYSYLGTWNHGRHNIQFGGDFRWQQYNVFSQNNPQGHFSFSGGATAQTTTVNGITSAVANTGYDFADFLIGTPDQLSIAFGNADKYLRAVQPDLFFTDEWKVSPGLSLTLGLRYEYTSPVTEKYGRLVNLDIAPGFAAVAPVVGSNPVGPLTGMTYPASLVKPDRGEIEPRLAFAWRPFPASSMVVRGGYGVYYNTQVYTPFVQQMDQQAPLSKSLQLANSAASPLTLANGFNTAANISQDAFAVDPNFRIGYSQNWYLSIQKDLPGSLVMQATYNGIKGTRLLQAFVPNSYPGGVTAACAPACSDFTYYTSNGNSTKEGGTLNLRRRLHNGFTATLVYTYSKAIDDVASLGGGLGNPAQNWLDLSGERGPSQTDQRHVADITLQYTSGMGMGGGTLLSGWRGKLIKDWTFLDTIHLATGLPLTPTLAGYLGSVSSGNLRASYTGQPIYAAPAGDFLNPLAVSQPAAGQWGNAGIGSIEGPDQFSMNASMQRSFRLNDRFTLSLTITASNPLNHVVFGTWGTVITSKQFGTEESPSATRNVSTFMRLTF